MGIVPIWGFQMAAAIVLSFLFRLNKPLVIIAANISFPPFIPLILFLSHYLGGFWMGDNAKSIILDRSISIEMLQDSLFQYVIGAFTLAVLAGVLFGAVAYWVLKIYRNRKAAADQPEEL
jgi:uncharacterized protein (DUF2062 family)